MHSEHAQLLSGPSDPMFRLNVHLLTYFELALKRLRGNAGIAKPYLSVEQHGH